MIERLDDGIKCPRANNIVGLGPQIGRDMLCKPDGIIRPAPDNQRRTGRRGPGIHNIRLRLKIGRATGTWSSWWRDTWINGQLFQRGEQHLPAVPTRPGWERNAEETLARNAPVPLQIL